MSARARVIPMAMGALALASSHAALPASPADPAFGHFDAPVKSEWALDGRTMALLAPVVFHDTQQNLVWTAPAGSLIDGASIPRPLWSVVGGPYEGLYRDASVPHDYECCVKQHPWRQVHRMFYDAMRARGVGEARAKWMYWAVYQFGPRWPVPGDRAGLPPADLLRQRMRESDARNAMRLIEARPTLGLEQLEQLDATAITRQLQELGVAVTDLLTSKDDPYIENADKAPPCVAR
jgi:hypothetical protein